VGVGWGHRKAGDDAGPADPNVHPEAVEEGLPEQRRVLAQSRLATEAFAPVGAGEEARGQGHRVHERESRIVGGEREELLPEALLGLPEVGCLSREGGPMHLVAQGREPSAVVTAKEEVDVLVVVSRPRNSPTTSMVRTSASESLGAGPRLLMRCPLSRSSMRQKTATMKVL
jgi:hypothetical protein